jgi:hypothetical protein
MIASLSRKSSAFTLEEGSFEDIQPTNRNGRRWIPALLTLVRPKQRHGKGEDEEREHTVDDLEAGRRGSCHSVSSGEIKGTGPECLEPKVGDWAKDLPSQDR